MEPMTTEKMIELQIVPKNYKSKLDELKEDDVKKIWASVKELAPECALIEDIPLSELASNESWHQKLIRRVVEYNRFKKRVHLSEGTAAWVAEDEWQATPEEIKAAKEKHKKALNKFWDSAEPSGVLVIERAEKMKKKWAQDAEGEKSKKAKFECTKEGAASEGGSEQ